MKFNVKKFVIILASIAAGSFIIAGILFYLTGGISTVAVDVSQIRTSKEYEAADVQKLIVKTVNTDVDIIPAVIKDIDIDFYGNVRTNLAGSMPELRTYLEEGILTVEIVYPRAINLGLINLSQLQLDIYIPGEYSGDVMVNTASGDLEINDLDLKNLAFQSTSGGLIVDSVTSKEIKIESTSGKIIMTDLAGTLDANTISGEQKVALKILSGDLNIKTLSGDVSVELPESSEFIFDLNSAAGDISSEFGAKISFVDSGRMEGTVGEGAFKITVESTSGDINILKGGK